jgi:hypothetical protein
MVNDWLISFARSWLIFVFSRQKCVAGTQNSLAVREMRFRPTRRFPNYPLEARTQMKTKKHD